MSPIACLKYFSDMIIHTDGVFSQSCYPHPNTPIDQLDHATVFNVLLERIIKSLRSVENEEVTSFYYTDSIYSFTFPNSWANTQYATVLTEQRTYHTTERFNH